MPRTQRTSNADKPDHRQEVTDTIIALMEEGPGRWEKPWRAGGLNTPYNTTSLTPYHGGNALYLMIQAIRRGYDDPRWLTYKQAQERGWQVRRGEKGTHIEYWEFPRTKPREGDADGDDDDRRPFVIHRVYTVFNASQVEGIPPYEPKAAQEWEIIDAGERILTNSGATIRHDQADRAYYSPAGDAIHLPPKEAFVSAPGYYGTALHELAHWSGHPSRLNRATLDRHYRFGSPDYAREELRAELASLFLAAERGIPYQAKSAAAYLKSWIGALKDDKNELFHAAGDAQRATDYLLALEQGEQPDPERWRRRVATDRQAARRREPGPGG